MRAEGLDYGHAERFSPNLVRVAMFLKKRRLTLKYLLVILIFCVCSCGNESTPRLKAFEAKKVVCKGDNDCVRTSAATSFPLSVCCGPCRQKYGRRNARPCRLRCLDLQRELVADGVDPIKADWTIIWQEVALTD